MYSGTTFRSRSGNLMGVHQKIDRVARRHLTSLIDDTTSFPSAKQILHFEGNNGPDAIKRKSPAVDEPWHYINPFDANDTALFEMIEEHIANLVVALRSNNQQRAAFEAAWMAHAITDGLTPPHHFPLEEKLRELRGEGLETRTTIVKKNLMPGDTKLEVLKNNWQFWGTKGVMTMHFGFEAGVASVVPYQRFEQGLPSSQDLEMVRRAGFRAYYLGCIHQVVEMQMYQKFEKNGWTTDLARQTNRELMPLIIRAVVLGWWSAIEESVR